MAFMEIDIFFIDFMIVSLGINGIIIYKLGFYGNVTGISWGFHGKIWIYTVDTQGFNGKSSIAGILLGFSTTGYTVIGFNMV